MLPGILRIILLTLLPLLAAAAAAQNPPAAPPRPTTSSPSLLLVATRQLRHPGFRETVVLVTRHGRRGPIGVIVNRPLEITLKRLFPQAPDADKLFLHEGGPVERGQISYLFRSLEMAPGTIEVAEHTYIGRSPELLGDLLHGRRPHSGLRVIAGYAGWAPGQLENEVARGDWLVLPVTPATLFETPVTGMWQELYRRATELRAHKPEPADAVSAAGIAAPML